MTQTGALPSERYFIAPEHRLQSSQPELAPFKLCGLESTT